MYVFLCVCVVFSPWCDSHCVGVGLYWEKASQRWRESLCLPDPSTPTTPTPSQSSWSNLSEVCVCVYVPVRWRQAFLLVFLPAVSLCLITFLCVHRLCTFSSPAVPVRLEPLCVCVGVLCERFISFVILCEGFVCSSRPFPACRPFVWRVCLLCCVFA